PVRIGRLDVKYQRKTPLCTHCKTFGHSTLSCKARPKTVEELNVKTLKDVLKVGRSDMGKSVNAIDDDGFVIVGKNNRPLNDHNIATQRNVSNRSYGDHGIQNKGFQNNMRRNFSGSWQSYGRQGPNPQIKFSKNKENVGGSKAGQMSKKNVNFVPKNVSVTKNAGEQT
ncbi:hypothetical protein Tco_0333987, partial [Tanacetum coccineum]